MDRVLTQPSVDRPALLMDVDTVLSAEVIAMQQCCKAMKCSDYWQMTVCYSHLGVVLCPLRNKHHTILVCYTLLLHDEVYSPQSTSTEHDIHYKINNIQ